MAESKGTLYLSAKLFAEQTFGAEAVEETLGQLSEEDRSLLGSVVAVGWYPLEPILRFHRVLDNEYGSGDLGLCVEIGKFACDWQLNRFHKFILRMKSPRWMLNRASQVWRTYHDTGVWEVEEPEPNTLRGRLHDFACVDRAFCARELGWFSKAVYLTGCKLLSIDEPRCRARGDAYCEYIASWS